MDVHRYDAEQDRDSVIRMWAEIGWLNPTSGGQLRGFDHLTEASPAWVAKLDGDAECFVACCPGTIRYLDDTIRLSAVAAVTTSRVARRQGLAKRLTALAVAEEAQTGAAVSVLSMFDQGFYDLLGFGTCTYEHRVRIDPQALSVPSPTRPPKRLGQDDWEAIHQSRLTRMPAHGAVSLTPPIITRSELVRSAKNFGLGYFDESGELTHHICCSAQNVGHGPYDIAWITYRTGEQFMELMGVIKSIGDQVRRVDLFEPQGIQLQDLMIQPFRTKSISEKSNFATGVSAMALFQMRICDLSLCLERTHLKCDEFRFSLALNDPIETSLDEDQAWRGVGGDYIVTLGTSCGVEEGSDPQLPTLTCSINALTRMWLGVRPATGLAITDQLTAPQDLLTQLDWAFRLPDPKTDWMLRRIGCFN